MSYFQGRLVCSKAVDCVTDEIFLTALGFTWWRGYNHDRLLKRIPPRPEDCLVNIETKFTEIDARCFQGSHAPVSDLQQSTTWSSSDQLSCPSDDTTGQLGTSCDTTGPGQNRNDRKHQLLHRLGKTQ